MMFGVVLVGTYTSIFIAAPILIYLGVGNQSRRGYAAEEQLASDLQNRSAGVAFGSQDARSCRQTLTPWRIIRA